jgi:hypothetical protein
MGLKSPALDSVQIFRRRRMSLRVPSLVGNQGQERLGYSPTGLLTQKLGVNLLSVGLFSEGGRPVAPKIIRVPVPEYHVRDRPDYDVIGSKVDQAIGKVLSDGVYIIRSIGLQDHAGLTLDQLVQIVLATGTDKYDSDRTAVGQEEFSGYDYDIQAGPVEVKRGRLEPDESDDTVFGGIARHFFEGAPLDRGYPVRIDLLLLYDPAKMLRARKRDSGAKGVRKGLNKFLYKFRDPADKKGALVGLVEILR